MKTLHKGPFITNNSHGFEYYLPDGEHILRVSNWTYGVSLHILNRVTLNYPQEMRIDKKKCPQWEDIVWVFEELAQKKYPRNIMRRGR